VISSLACINACTAGMTIGSTPLTGPRNQASVTLEL
jgi:hypothetical protein